MTHFDFSHHKTTQKQPASTFELAQQTQKQQHLWRWLKQIFPASEQDLLSYLSQQLCQGQANLTEVKQWLLTQLARLSQWSPHRMSYSEWLALVMAAGLMVSSLSQPLLVSAQEPVGSEFQVNSYTTSSQMWPGVGMGANGEFVIAWASHGQDGDDYGIYAQRYNANGVAEGDEFRVNLYTQGDQHYPRVGMDGEGNFVITWELCGDGGSSHCDIFARRYDASGTALGNEFPVNTHFMNGQRFPEIEMNADGNFVITWLSNAQDGDQYGIYAQRYNASGTALGGEFRVNTTTTGIQFWSNVGMDDDGDFVIAWGSSGQDGSGYGVYAQRYNASGVALGGEFQVNTSTLDWQQGASIGMDADGNFVIAWQSEGTDGDEHGVFGQRYDVDGAAQGTEFQINTTSIDNQLFPSVGMDTDGNFVVAWLSGSSSGPGQDGSLQGIYAQRYNASGTPQGSEFQINTYTTDRQGHPNLGMASNGDFVVVWDSGSYTGVSQDGSMHGIYAQRFGTPPPAPEMSIIGQEQEIADGDTSPVTTDDTDFGNVRAGNGTLAHTFTISNTGEAELILSTVAISGTHSSDFSVTQQPNSTVAANSLTTFTVQFTPTAVGLRSAAVSISNNDDNENPYNFAIQGIGVAPEIAVSGNGQDISDGDTTPSPTDHTDFGNILASSGTIQRTFTISNTGDAPLNLSGTPKVEITGTDAGDFTVTAQPADTVPTSGNTTFIIEFDPSAVGTQTAEVSIENDDDNEHPYTFTIQGTGTEDLIPEIDVSGNGQSIVTGSTTPTTTNHTDFGSIRLNDTLTRTFTIINNGNANLNLTGDPKVIINGTNASEFSVAEQPSSPVASGGGSSSFTITFVPSEEGVRVAEVAVANDDSDESPYTFTIQGIGTVETVYLPLIVKP